LDYLDWYRLFVRLIACSILVHDLLYICRDGKSYITSCILPTFGLRLNEVGKVTVHLGLLFSCLGMIWQPMTLILYPICLAFLSLKIASYSLRLANHMIFAWFLLLLLCIPSLSSSQWLISENDVIFVIGATQGLVIILYFFAFFHKLNREYFVMTKSCATAFVDFFCSDRNISKPRILHFYRYFGVYGTVIIEAMIPLLLCFESTRIWGLILAIGFHFILALIGIVNFSMFMYTGLFAFLNPIELNILQQPLSNSGMVGLSICVIMFLLVVWRWTPRKAAANCDYVYRNPAWVIQSAFAILSGCFLYTCITAMLLNAVFPSLLWSLWQNYSLQEHVILSVFLLTFFSNGIGPYLGYKTEFSFAMFSNLRIEPWGHWLIPVSWRLFRKKQYIEVTKIEGLPLLEEVKGDRATELAVFVLSQPEEYYYSRYFFREALRILAKIKPNIIINFIENDVYREVKGYDTKNLGFCLPINLFPFVMPRNLEVPHSEQGALVPKQANRQLF